MSFKEQIQDDIKDVFLNTNEFGDLHNIDGQDIAVIVDDDLLKQQSLKMGQGVYLGEILLHVADLPDKPALGQHMEFDNKIYRVNDVQENDGIFSIIIGKNKS